MPEKRLTVARLREMARALELPLDEEDLTRLTPMVADLVGESRRLRRHAPGAIAQLEHPGE